MMRRLVRFGLLLVTTFYCSVLLAAPSMATVVFSLPISFEQCHERVIATMQAAGFSGTREFGNGLIASRENESASIGCIHGRGETVVMIVVASGGDGVPALSRDRLAALMRGESAASSQSARCTFQYTGWDGAHWSARIEQGVFVHAPDGDFTRAHSDSVIRYKTGDGGRWTAKIAASRFIHAPDDDWSNAHPDVILNYIDWSGAPQTFTLPHCLGTQ